MTDLRFTAAECQEKGNLALVSYGFQRKGHHHWIVLREGREVLDPGPGFVPVRVLACGLCATDLARPYLPFPLPQVTGHEVVADHQGRLVVVDINASHATRGLATGSCPYCRRGLDRHCPDRLTLGIDRLPGGFAPWLLAPLSGIRPLPAGVSKEVAPLVEPLAAALRALEATPPRVNEKIAVLGPRRLGMLLIAALVGSRDEAGPGYQITALARHSHLLALAGIMGADQGVDPSLYAQGFRKQFDTVFDTTGSPAGLALALRLARRVVHLKSTHGREVMGMNHLADLVVDELALLGYAPDHLAFSWPHAPWENQHILVTPDVDLKGLPENPHVAYHVLSPEQATSKDEVERRAAWRLPQFDLAIVGSLASADRVIRPTPSARASLVRPMGAILLKKSKATSPLEKALLVDKIQIHTSRCGCFEATLAFLADHPPLAKLLVSDMITDVFPLERIQEAYASGSNGARGIKTVVDCTADILVPV